ncbi:UPF0262 family protein [Aestuariispira insulae]|uniref:UPF0262 protein DFP90_10281 n=1 Tax=Aestuariispira insulae TaxID=1461337 RepID=A0A3D9HRA4_9PROT|nr:UPF0262 family protein [Aestuariispira insulae]RED52064.1 uncharacterized protein (UPF0262 family) [Aestuariispira insulae]
MSDWDSEKDRITDIKLEEGSVVRRSPEVEHERAVAMYDLLDMNRFRPVGAEISGPYKVMLAIEDGKRLHFKINNEADELLSQVILAMSPFRRLIRDYFQICESYYDAIKRLSPSQIETIDMARRGLHNEGSDLLRERLQGKLEMDQATSRRLFTLICVLHIRA